MFIITRDKLGFHIQMELEFDVIQGNGSSLGLATLDLSNNLWEAAWCGIPAPVWLAPRVKKKDELEGLRKSIQRYGDAIREQNAKLTFNFWERGDNSTSIEYTSTNGLDAILRKYADDGHLEGITITKHIEDGPTLTADYFPDDCEVNDYEKFRVLLCDSSDAVILWVENTDTDYCKDELDTRICTFVLDELGEREQSA